YCGWLLLNLQFRQEHRQLFERWQEQMGQFGVPQQELFVSASQGRVSPEIAQATGEQAQYAQAFWDFYTRWRLANLAAPYLPQPLMPQLPVSILQHVLGHMRHGGTTFYFPDIYPVPS